MGTDDGAEAMNKSDDFKLKEEEGNVQLAAKEDDAHDGTKEVNKEINNATVQNEKDKNTATMESTVCHKEQSENSKKMEMKLDSDKSELESTEISPNVIEGEKEEQNETKEDA